MKKHSVNNNNINNNMNVSIVSNWKQQHKLQNTKNENKKNKKPKKEQKKMLGVMLSWAPVKLSWQPRLTWSMIWVQLGPYKVSR